MNSPYLSFEIEEVIRKIHFTRGKKSYIALLAKDDEFKNWQRDIPSNKTELKIRGAPWSK